MTIYHDAECNVCGEKTTVAVLTLKEGIFTICLCCADQIARDIANTEPTIPAPNPM